MKKYNVDVSAWVSFEIEADSQEEAEDKAEEEWFRRMQFAGSKHITITEK